MLRRNDLIGLMVVITGVGLFASTTLAQPVSVSPAAKPAIPAASTPSLRAELVDPEAKAKKASATVSAEAIGISIIDPALAQEQPRSGEGHFHYQVDNGPVIATTAAKLSFHGLTPGKHTIKVTLATNDHQPAAESVVLTVTVP